MNVPNLNLPAASVLDPIAIQKQIDLLNAQVALYDYNAAQNLAKLQDQLAKAKK